MRNLAILVWVYGTIVLVGGLIGWLKARSTPSLLSGLVFGVLLWWCGRGLWHGQPFGLTAAMVLALALALVMGARFVKTKKFMPSGLVAGLSVVVCVILVVAML